MQLSPDMKFSMFSVRISESHSIPGSIGSYLSSLYKS